MERERRLEARVLCADMVEIRWRDVTGKLCKVTALLEDIAPAGACLQLEEPVPLGTEIAWEAGDQFFAGYVRYCTYREIGYFVGVEFGESSRWSKRSYRPQHLLDLEQILAGSKRR